MNDELISHWDAEADTFDQATDHGLEDPPVRAAWLELLESVMPAVPARIADLGCGTGTLSLLLAEMGHEVSGVDFSPAMLAKANAKAAGQRGVSFRAGDAADPDLPHAAFDVVLSRHVLWALPDQTEVLRRWSALLTHQGRMILIEGRWHTGAGLTAQAVTEMLHRLGRTAHVTQLADPRLWGREISDERYLVLSRARS